MSGRFFALYYELKSAETGAAVTTVRKHAGETLAAGLNSKIVTVSSKLCDNEAQTNSPSHGFQRPSS